jgi:hypothetical protein
MSKINYTVPEHIQFVEDMKNAGLKVKLYHGRYFWHGPSVDVNNLQDALSNTKVPCQWDNMGMLYVVYPKANDPSLDGNDISEEEEEN